MKLIVGLGNPGEKYKNTRHNVGFMALDYLLSFDGFMDAKPSREFKSEMYSWSNKTPSGAEGQSGEDKIIFLKPQTYMNDSGQALKVICNFYKLDLSKELLVIHDDTDLPLGEIRLTDSSSSAGHNGVQSIIDNIGTQNFNRVRIGVDTRQSRDDMPTEAYVLQNFSDEELKKLREEVLPKVETEIKKFIQTN
jgi:PTH1 family peptidyl-tRNA hydrolase